MTYKERYNRDMDIAYEEMKFRLNENNDYRNIRRMNVLLEIVSNIYEIVAEIGDKVNEESGSE